MANQTQHFASASLYVGDLNPDVTEAKLYEMFNSVGPVASIRVCRDSISKKSLGYAYVNYHSLQDAERALDTLNYSQIRGHQCRIMWSHRDPALRKSGAGNIFVKNLDREIDNKALYDTFSLFGNILSCKVAYDDFAKSRGFGFVHYEAEESAKTAIEKVNGMQIGSKTVFVGPFVRKHERQGSRGSYFTNIYIKNIPNDWTEDKLKEEFSKFGEITSFKLTMDQRRGRPFSFVNFSEPESAKAAVDEMNGKVFPSSNRRPEPEKDEAATETEVKKEDETSGEVSDKNIEEDEANKQAPLKEEEAVPLYVSRAQTKRERYTLLRSRFEVATPERARRFQGKNVYIKNLDDSIDDAKLQETFEAFGTISSAKVMRDERGVSKGFGFVCFLTPEEATKAINDMHLKQLNNKPLYVGLAEKREHRAARLNNRFRGIANLRQGPVVTTVPTQLQFHAPPQMYYNSMPQPRPVIGYNHQPNVMSWRPPVGGHRPFSQGVGNMPAPMSSMIGYQAMGPMGNNSMAMGGGAMRAARPPYRGNMNMHVNPKGQQMAQFSPAKQPYKFTPQARNREYGPGDGLVPVGLGGDPGIPSGMVNGGKPDLDKQSLGEQLFPLVTALQPELAGKITGMMLEMDNQELMVLLHNEVGLKSKVDEALRVLKNAKQDVAAL